jgi:hypothetical protein
MLLSIVFRTYFPLAGDFFLTITPATLFSSLFAIGAASLLEGVLSQPTWVQQQRFRSGGHDDRSATRFSCISH